MSESRGASNHRSSRGDRVKGQFSGALVSPAAEKPLDRITADEDPSEERGGEGSVARSTRDNLPSSPSKASGIWKSFPEGVVESEIFTKDARVSTRWVGVLVPGSWYPHKLH